MSRINPWADPKKRAAIMRGIRLAAKKRRIHSVDMNDAPFMKKPNRRKPR